MALRGDLSTISLADLFQTLSISKKVGTLVVSDGESRKCIHFGSDGVRLVSSGSRKGLQLGEMLVRAGRITQTELEDALAIQKKLGLKLGEVFQRVGLVNPDEVNAAVRQQIEEEIYDLFGWKEATFEFKEGEPPPADLVPPDAPVTSLVFDCNTLIMEAARRLDEWEMIRKAIPDFRLILIPAVPPERFPPPTPGSDAFLLPLADGSRTVEKVITDSCLTKFDACSKLYRLLTQKLVKLAKAEDLRHLAEAEWTAGQQDRAFAILMAATGLAPDDPSIRRPLAHMLRDAGKWPEAASQYNLLGLSYLKGGVFNHALAAFQTALECEPNNLEARAGLFELHLKQNDRAKAVNVALQLVPALMAQRQFKLARSICDGALALAPTNVEMQVHRASLLQEMGDKVDGQDQLERVLDSVPSGSTKLLHKLHEKIRSVDPDRKLVLQKLAQHISDRNLRKSTQHRRMILVYVGAAIFLAVGGWIAYEWRARSRCAPLWEQARQFQEGQKWNEARALYQQMIDAYPMTFNARAAARAQVEVDEARDQAHRAAEEEQRRRRDEHAQMLDRGVALESENVKEALRLYQEVLTWAANSENNALDLRERAQKQIEAVKTYFEEAEALAKEAAALEEAGNYDDARPRWQKLLTKYRRAPVAEKTTFPLRVETIPRGARVFQDGAFAGAGPVTLRLRPGQGCDLRVEARGFLPYRKAIAANDPALASVVLEKTSLWQFTCDGPIATRPLVVRNLVIFGSRDRSLYALDRQSGALLWKFTADVSGDILSSPILAGELVVAGSNDGRLYAVQVANGRSAWTYTVGRFVKATPVLAENGKLVVVGACDSKVHAVRADTGEGVWKFPTGDQVLSSGAVAGDTVLVGSDDGNLYALSGATGKKLWSAKVGGPIQGGIAVDRGMAVFGCGDGKVYAYSLTGSPLWQFPTGDAVVATPVLADGVAYVGSRDGNVYALDQAGGAQKWRCDTGKPVTGGAAVAGKTLYVGSENGVLYGLDLDNGKVRWKWQTRDAVHSTPTVAEDVVFFGSDDRHLFALEQ